MEVLSEYLPEHSHKYVSELIDYSGVELRIVKGRKTKYGDYKQPLKGRPAVVTVNKDLNKYAFLLTLVHELAHAFAYIRFGKRIHPHGKEWKSTFRDLLEPLQIDSIFPAEILTELSRHMKNPKASTGSDASLFRVLRSFDTKTVTYLEDLNEGDKFELKGGRTFIKGPQKRKNFLCVAESNRRKYLINPLAEVRLLQKAFEPETKPF